MERLIGTGEVAKTLGVSIPTLRRWEATGKGGHRRYDNKVGCLVVTHKNRLLRFGAELAFAICEAKNVENART